MPSVGLSFLSVCGMEIQPHAPGVARLLGQPRKVEVWCVCGGVSSVNHESVPKEACGLLFHSSRVSSYPGNGDGGLGAEVDGEELSDPEPREES